MGSDRTQPVLIRATKPRVLLADDYPPLLQAMQRFLQSECDIVGCVTTVDDLLAAARVQRPDVVVVDLTLPPTGGLDVCRRLKSALPQVRVVVISADEDPTLIATALEAGASHFIVKSTIEEQILPAITN